MGGHKKTVKPASKCQLALYSKESSTGRGFLLLLLDAFGGALDRRVPFKTSDVPVVASMLLVMDMLSTPFTDPAAHDPFLSAPRAYKCCVTVFRPLVRPFEDAERARVSQSCVPRSTVIHSFTLPQSAIQRNAIDRQ